jgi:hypothetical protein
MKKLIIVIALGLLTLGIAAYAQGPGYGPGWRRGPGMMGPGYGPGYGRGQGMGPGMMWGEECPGWGSSEYAPPERGVSADQAKDIANQYTDKYLKGFTVERVLPFTGMPHAMYGVELKGPKGEVRHLRISPWGGVMPFAGGPWAAQ